MPELSNIKNAVLLAAIGAVAFLYSSIGHGGVRRGIWRSLLPSDSL